MRLRGFVVAVCVLSAGWSWLQSPDPDVERGNEAFAEEQYNVAIAAYRDALQRRGTDARIHYDLGAAFYVLAEQTDIADRRKAFYEQAEESFRNAVHAENTDLAAKASYNLGNALFRQGRYRDAAEAYKRALRANPHNDNARYNLELALRHRRKGSARGGRGAPQSLPDHGDAQKPGAGRSAPEPPGQGRDRASEKSNGQDGSRAGPQGSQSKQGSSSQSPAPDGTDTEPGQGRERSADAAQGTQGGQDRARQDSQPADEPGKSANKKGRDAPRSRPGRDREDTSQNSDVDKKLDALERMSRELYRQKLRRSAPRPGYRTRAKDW